MIIRCNKKTAALQYDEVEKLKDAVNIGPVAK